MLIIDDLHLAGQAVADWLTYVVGHGQGLPLAIVASRRAGEPLDPPKARTVLLGPLDLAATVAVVGPERAAELHDRSGGHPLFLVELAGADPDQPLPTSIRDAVAASCARAGAAARTLQAAAVIGRDIDVDLLAAVLQSPAVTLIDHLDEGVRGRFLLEQEQSFAFRHALVREALVAGVTPARKALLHREAARVLRSRPRTDPMTVAWHPRLGGDPSAAAAALVEAAAVASSRFDQPEAERLLDQAIALDDSPTARLLRARVRSHRQRYAEAAADADAALAMGAGARALEVAGWVAHYRRDLDAAARLADDAARLAEDEETRAACLTLGGRVRHAAGDLEAAEERLTRAVAHAGPDAVLAALWLGSLRAHQGRPVEALELVRPATLPGARATSPLPTAHAHSTRPHTLGQLGRPAAALAALDDLDAEVARQHTERFVGRAANWRGWVLRNIGAWPRRTSRTSPPPRPHRGWDWSRLRRTPTSTLRPGRSSPAASTTPIGA